MLILGPGVYPKHPEEPAGARATAIAHVYVILHVSGSI